MHITNINGTLLKNTVISKGNDRYISEALYEDNDGYYTSRIAFSIYKKDGEWTWSLIPFSLKSDEDIIIQ